MLCYRCGSHVPDSTDSCGTCGQKLAGGGVRQATGTFSRKRPQGAALENAPYKPGDVVSGRYEIRDAIGGGAVGAVFRAHDREVDVEVALKVVNPRLVQTAEERRAFGRAIRLGRKLSHQNLIRVYEDGEDGERPWYTMQLLEGLTLRKIIDLRTQKGELFTLREVEPILGQIAHALDGAHKVGAHCNVKPDNVIVLPDLLKVSDFALPLAIPRLPFVQAAKGRKADRYLAPEYVGGQEVDARADLYSLGVIMGEMLSGLTPDGAVPELTRRNPELPPAIEGLYRRALNTNPLARPKTAGALFEEFVEITRKASPPPLKKGPEAPPPPAVTRVRPPPPPPVAAVGPTTHELRRRVLEKEPLPPPVPVEEVDVSDAADTQALPQLPFGETMEIRAQEPTRRDGRVIPDSVPPAPVTLQIPGVGDRDETALMPSFPSSEMRAVEPHGDPTESRFVAVDGERKGGRGIVLFAVITLAGLAAGAAGGYWYLGKHDAPVIAQGTGHPPTAPVPLGAQGAVPVPLTQPVEPAVAVADGTPQQGTTTAPTAPVPLAAAADPTASRKGDPLRAAEDARRRAEEARRLEEAQAEARRRIEEATTAEEKRRAEAAQAEAQRLAEEQRRAEEARRAQEAARLAEAQRKAEDTRSAAAIAAANAGAGSNAASGDTAQGSGTSGTTVAAAATAGTTARRTGECADGMRHVPGGTFRMGTARDDPMMGFDERILGNVEVSDFCIDTYEFPNRRGAMPKVNVSWSEAKRLCEGQGKRLCTEEEWEKACKGPGNTRFPYGNTFDAELCNTEDELGEDRPLVPAGRYGKCRSGYGVSDLSGNAAEWTASNYAGNQDKAQKGGSHTRPDYASRCSARRNGSPSAKAVDVGFRCCSDP